MSIENKLLTQTFQASGNLSASQYCAMKIDTNGQLAVAGVDDPVAGVLQDNPSAQYRAATLGYSGTSKMVCGGTVTAGQRVTTNSSGQAIALASGSAWSVGVAREAGSSGTIISVFLQIVGAEYSALPN